MLMFDKQNRRKEKECKKHRGATNNSSDFIFQTQGQNFREVKPQMRVKNDTCSVV